MDGSPVARSRATPPSASPVRCAASASREYSPRPAWVSSAKQAAGLAHQRVAQRQQGDVLEHVGVVAGVEGVAIVHGCAGYGRCAAGLCSAHAACCLSKTRPAIADTVAYALREDGFDVHHCLTAGDALRAAGDGRFDLAILDVGLPDLGRLRAVPRTAPRARPPRDLPHRACRRSRAGAGLRTRRGRLRRPSPSRRANWWRACARCCGALASHARAGAAATAFEHDAEGHRIR